MCCSKNKENKQDTKHICSCGAAMHKNAIRCNDCYRKLARQRTATNRTKSEKRKIMDLKAVEEAPILCVHCGKNPARKTRTTQSKYCSEQCAKESHALACSKANAERNPDRASEPIRKDWYFPALGKGESFLDAQIYPFGI